MITDGFSFVALLLALSALLLYLERRRRLAVFAWVPAMVFMYLIAATLNTVGVFGSSDSVADVGGGVKDAILPAMIFLYLFRCDLRKIIRLGPKLLLTFFTTTCSILTGMVVVYLLFKAVLAPESWKALAALTASWTGGSANMVAVQGILHAPENIFGYVLMVDTILYSVWLLLMFSSVAFSARFNRFTGADTSYLDAHTGDDEDDKRAIDVVSIAGTIGGSIAVSALATWVGSLLPTIGVVVNQTTWTILIVSVLGLIVAVTPLGATAGTTEVATVMLMLVIGIIASGSDFTALLQAPLYLLAGALVLLFHAVFMLGYAKLTRTELFSIAVASTAHIGGVASAPVVASAFNRQLVPVGILFALIGSFMGTFVGLFAGQIMSGL